MAALGRIVRTTCAHVVISSTWRWFDKSMAELKAAFASAGLDAPAGVTGSMCAAEADGLTGEAIRVAEIQRYLAEHAAPGVRWIALDDMNLAGAAPSSEFAARCVRTKRMRGLTAAHVDAAIAAISSQAAASTIIASAGASDSAFGSGSRG